MSEFKEKGPAEAEERTALAISRRDAFRFSGMGLAAIALVPGMLSAAWAESAFAAEPLSVSLPTNVSYARRADGSLIGPSPSATQMRNLSDREVRVKSVKATAAEGWNLVQDASTSSLPNSAQLSLGVESDQLNLADYTEGAEVNDELAWTMARASDSEELSTLDLVASGNVANLTGANGSTSDPDQMGTAEWHVASDTVLDDLLNQIADLESRVEELEEENTTLTTTITEYEQRFTELDETIENLTELAGIEEVFINKTEADTLEKYPALVVNTSDMSLWLATAD